MMTLTDCNTASNTASNSASNTAMASNSRPPAPLMQAPSLALLVYPLTLLLGSLFAAISPTAQTPALSGPDATPPINYFARKSNIFNLYFVKLGWLWTTLAFCLLLLLLLPSSSSSSSSPRTRSLAQSLLRYMLVTVSWYLTTQWCFGPALIDRSFVLTGGKCQDHGAVGVASPQADSRVSALLSAAACKAAGGAWRGGTDVSGHVFMLVLASAFLAFETVGVVRVSSVSREDQGRDELDGSSVNNNNGGSSSSSSSSKEKQDKGSALVESPWRTAALRFVYAVVTLDWWMLLMTAIWFHTWLEKWSGLLLALSTIYTVYILPRSLGSWRNIVGIPGV